MVLPSEEIWKNGAEMPVLHEKDRIEIGLQYRHRNSKVRFLKEAFSTFMAIYEPQMNKYIMKSILTSFLLMVATIMVAQPGPSYTLVLKNIEIKYGGETISVDDISTELVSNQPKIIDIYSADGNRYYLEAKILVRGKEIKLRMQNFLSANTGKLVKGKYRKYVHYLKVGINGSYEGNGTESLLIDPKKMNAMKAIYKFELQYAQ